MNNEWEFVRDFRFYCLVGIVAALPVAILLAAASRTTYEEATKRFQRFLTQWASLGSNATWKVVLTGVAGVSGSVVLLALLAWGLSRIGDIALPHASSALDHFDTPRVAWSIEYPDEWHGLRYQYRELSGIKADLQEWERAKDKFGAGSYRFFRIMFCLALLIAAAGVTNLLRRLTWRKGTLELAAGVALTVLATALWVDRNDRYIRNLAAEYKSLVATHAPPMPAHYPDQTGENFLSRSELAD
jgi:hypothetical protein